MEIYAILFLLDRSCYAWIMTKLANLSLMRTEQLRQLFGSPSDLALTLQLLQRADKTATALY